MRPRCFLPEPTKKFSPQNGDKIEGRNWASFLDENAHMQLHMSFIHVAVLHTFFFFFFFFFPLGYCLPPPLLFLFFLFFMIYWACLSRIFFFFGWCCCYLDVIFLWTWFLFFNKFRWLIFFFWLFITFLVLIGHQFFFFLWELEIIF